MRMRRDSSEPSGGDPSAGAALPRPEPPSKRATTPEAPKTFLLGVGCQKGGTSWLHQYLSASPQCQRGHRKEYHIFDSLDLSIGRPYRRGILRSAEAALGRLQEGLPADRMALHLAGMLADPNLYFNYFTGLLYRRPGVRLALDITPTYAGISAERLDFIRDGFARRGVRVVAAFLMRDPVARVWSHARMQQRRKPSRFVGPLEDRLRSLMATNAYEVRTNYHHTIDALDAVFDGHEVYFGFYEELFAEPALRSLCDLLGIDFVEPDLDVRRNPGGRAEPLSDETTRVVAEHYADVYRAVAARFPERDLLRLWPSSRFVM